MLRYCVKSFKTAAIMYEGNDMKLIEKLSKLAVSSSRGLANTKNTIMLNERQGLADFDNDDASVFKKASAKNIKKKLAQEVVDWFSAVKPGAFAPNIDDSQNATIAELGGKRFIVVTVCIPESLKGDTVKCEELINAIDQFLKRLDETDFVCINLGNSELRLFGDH